MRKSDFKKGTVIEIPSEDGRFCYTQVIIESEGFAPLLGLLDGVFKYSLANSDFDKHNWKLKKYVHVNSTSSRAYPSVASWNVCRIGGLLLRGITEPIAIVHGTRTSGWTVVMLDGTRHHVNGQDCFMKDFECKGYAGKVMWLSKDIEDYMFEDVPMVFPDT